MKVYITSIYLIFQFFNFCIGQEGEIKGVVKVDGKPTAFVSIVIEGTSITTETEENGTFKLQPLDPGLYRLIFSYLGYRSEIITVSLKPNEQSKNLFVELNESLNIMNEVVISATKSFKKKKNTPVTVNVLNSSTLELLQACNLADGLKFLSGLRIENNCQTCNYTQLRINGLAGGYTQVLINGRPLLSPLTGLYGLEQIPSNMIEKIEVVKGGGSSLYGSNAIGGTVNVITRTPKKSSFEFGHFFQKTGNRSDDHITSGNFTLVSKTKKHGISMFYNRRQREHFDTNDDNFSEIPHIKNTSLGFNLFYKPDEKQKVEVNLSHITEYRFGGEMVDLPAHLAQQAEERNHRILMASVEYQLKFNNDKSSCIGYIGWQNTGRKHYTGILPEIGQDYLNHLNNPPYGKSKSSTFQTGFQLNHRLDKFIIGTNYLTFGSELLVDKVDDSILAYNYKINQTTNNLGAFTQSDWEISPKLSLLAGIRIDHHNFVDPLILSPRISILIKPVLNTQVRFNYGSGFRAPQAFDTDLHLAFAGGGVSRIYIAEDLIPEKSQSLSGSVNYDRPMEKMVYGFTLEAFYTHIKNTFYLQHTGSDNFGETFQKRNGGGATVKGLTLEMRANFLQRIQIEGGFTLQTSTFDEAIEYIQGLSSIRPFIRTPTTYGFSTLTLKPTDKLNININYVLTGSMLVPHFRGAQNQTFDEIIVTNPFSELNFKLSYDIALKKGVKIEFFGGLKNVINSYQDDFDIGKNRDSNFTYGPILPRSFYIGIKVKG